MALGVHGGKGNSGSGVVVLHCVSPTVLSGGVGGSRTVTPLSFAAFDISGTEVAAVVAIIMKGLRVGNDYSMT